MCGSGFWRQSMVRSFRCAFTVVVVTTLALLQGSVEARSGDRCARRCRCLCQPAVTCGQQVPFAAAYAEGIKSPVKLEIATVGPIRSDRLRVRITVSNTGTASFVWDKEFAVLLDWVIGSDSGEQIFEHDMQMIERPEKPFDANRFVQLKPGESISKTVDLAAGYRIFFSGHGSILSQDGMLHVPTAYEAVAKFKFPKDASAVRISASYASSNLDNLGGDTFEFYFGRTLRAAGIPEGPFESNRIRVVFSDGAVRQ